MSDIRDSDAPEVLRGMLRWAAQGQLDWEISPATLKFDEIGDIAWLANPKIGSPIIITHRVFSLGNSDLAELAHVATALLECGSEVEGNSYDRDDFERVMRSTARSLLRRKAATGIRLVSW